MRLWEKVVAGAVAVVLAVPASLLAQQPTPSMVFLPEELEQLAAPIALYSDPLLAQVLMAATYPLEVVQAARFVRANPALSGGRLDEALRAQNWDDSVKGLAHFPQILNMMDDKLDWTQKLGDAFLAQEQDLMDAVQRLRALARAQGTLATTAQQIVTYETAPGPPIIQIVPANPEVIYVPVYNPLVVYGPWPYPVYPPYFYYPPGWPAAGAFFSFGAGVIIGFGLWGACDWHRHTVFVDVPRYRHFTEVVNVEGRRGEIERGRIGPREGERLAWQHNVQHRKGVEYRDTVTQQRFGRPTPADARSREPFRGRLEQPRVNQPRPEQRQVAQPRVEQGRPPAGRGVPEPVRPSVEPGPRPELSRPQQGSPPRAEPRVQASPAPVSAHQRQPGVFPGPGSAADTRTHSERGRESRQSAAAPAPSVRSAPVRTAPGGGVHLPSAPSAPSGSVPGGGGPRR
jgi:uncharacterized protein DUF3300